MKRDRWDYNCGGYALQTFDWYNPSLSRGYLWYSRKQEKKRLRRMVMRILADFSDVRVVQSFDDLQPDEYGILFRIGKRDFHFIKYGRNHQYYHKQGAMDIERISAKSANAMLWFGGGDVVYTSPIVRFAKKIN